MIELIRRSFVPAAVNLYEIREAKNAAGELFRSVQNQQPQYQGLWIAAPDGRVLAAHHEIKSHETWTRDVRTTLEAGLKAFGPVAPRQAEAREPLPYRGAGVRPDGSVRLALYTRHVRGGGKERAPAAANPQSLWLWDGPVKPDGPPVIDSIALTASEWRAFGPPNLEAGELWILPEAVARKFSRALSPGSDQSTMPRPEEASLAELTAEVEAVEPETARIRLTGRWATKHIYLEKASYAWASGTGSLVVERASGRPRSLRMAIDGAYRMAPPYDTSDRPIAAVVEWRRGALTPGPSPIGMGEGRKSATASVTSKPQPFRAWLPSPIPMGEGSGMRAPFGSGMKAKRTSHSVNLNPQPSTLNPHQNSLIPVVAQEIPVGEVQKHTFSGSNIFPGTVRDYWVYIPAQYDGKTPACLYVNQDGLQWNAPKVFDRLIQAKEMPVTIGVFVMHGRTPAEKPDAALDRFNRSFEYDGLGDRYARFLAEELLPDVEKRTANDGRPIRLSRNPDDRAIGGASSGAVCAFTAAWERPDLFRRVFSAIGTYVGLRGADRYPTLVRKYEPKPLRIFLEDGSNDLNIYAGDWWMANQMIERALTFAGYQVTHVWGEGGHNGTAGTALFPDAMRWLWKDHPAPVTAGRSKNAMLNEILKPGEGWEAREEAPMEGAFRVQGPDGRVFRHMAGKGIFAGKPGEPMKRVADLKSVAGFTVAHSGDVWAVETARGGGWGMLWRITPDGRKSRAAEIPFEAGGVTLSPDQTLLYVSEPSSHWVWSWQIGADGSVKHGQKYYWIHAPDEDGPARARSMCVDRDGRLYVATRLGVQVCDQAGRVNAILPLPGSPAVTAVSFGGDDGTTLYALAGGKTYRRTLGVKGRHAWEPPNKPAAPRL